MTLKKVGRLEEADRQSTYAIQLAPDAPDVQTTRAHILRALGRAEEALALYRQSAEACPGDAARWNMVGVLALSTSRLAEAEAAFETAFSLDNGLIHVLINQGLLAQAQGDYATAIAQFEAAAQRNPGFLEECWPGRLEADPFQHLDNDSIMRFAGLPYHLGYCRWMLSGEAKRLKESATPSNAGDQDPVPFRRESRHAGATESFPDRHAHTTPARSG
jgi:tetratricopeptide (TPR) repeat protein